MKVRRKTRHVTGSTMLNLVSGGKFPMQSEALANTPQSIPLSGNVHFQHKKDLIRIFKEIDIFFQW